jgi:hypothetical protein
MIRRVEVADAVALCRGPRTVCAAVAVSFADNQS